MFLKSIKVICDGKLSEASPIVAYFTYAITEIVLFCSLTIMTPTFIVMVALYFALCLAAAGS